MDPLTGDGVRLRDFRSADLDDLLAITGDDRVTNWMAFDSHTREKAQQLLDGCIADIAVEPRTVFGLAITRIDDDQVIGFIRLAGTGGKAAKLGYMIAADHWGNGYATDATRTMLRFAFGPLALHRVTAAIGPENSASIAVVKRLGFTYEGHLRDHVFTNGGWRDSVLYSLLSTETASLTPR
ncbi:GNAT family N-acetyltransferase [Kribbella qitaiheensis]|uniref:GNAT family N-acetyltransferase n=1 Tax=Kribbella qitaiheensis TaxID=1544730 RepID=A0A7G6X133_9ACTN|nr:GNAT family protein [Kribbella qitaiheensis]QNE19948.1 GNAT family N-acetyltransferase [Kribbella qitaiheensis]